MLVSLLLSLLTNVGLGERFKCESTRHPAYDFSNVKETSLYSGGSFSISGGLSCDTDAGYSGNPSALMCTESGGFFTLKGCLSECTEPTKTGYKKHADGLTKDIRSLVGFDVQGWICDDADNFSGIVKVLPCSEDQGSYELEGCHKHCKEPKANTTGYRKKMGGLSVDNKKFHGFNVLGWECDKDNHYGGHATVQRCPTGGTDYVLTGCSSPCLEPTDTTGYQKPPTGLTRTKRFLEEFDVGGWECAPGYSGTAVASACSTHGTAYVLSGCVADCTTPVFTGYSNSPGYTKNLSYNSFKYTGIHCDTSSGYSGTASVSRCPSPGTNFILSGCKGCNLPDMSLKKTGNLVEDLSWNSFSVSGYTCNDKFEGTPVFSRCSTGGQPFTTSGCTKKCIRPSAKTGYVASSAGLNESLGRDKHFLVSGWNCAEGYSGTVTISVCPEPGTAYTLSGCTQDCLKPSTPSGYSISGGGLASTLTFSSFSVTGYTCAPNYIGTPVANRCPSPGTVYTVTGCLPNMDCNHPTGPAYVVNNKDKEINLAISNFSIADLYWKCAEPYVKSKAIEATVCTENNRTYTLEGCYKPCKSQKENLPLGYSVESGKTFTEGQINFGDDGDDGFENPTNLECAEGYAGTVKYTACPSPDTDYTISGCQKDCSHPPSVEGYKHVSTWDSKKDNIVLSSTDEFALEKCGDAGDKICWECDEGYGFADSDKKVEATVCAPGGIYTLSGCSKKCKEPTMFEGFKKPDSGLDPEKLAIGEFEVDGWECASGYAEDSDGIKAEVCDEPGKEYHLKGCIRDCETPDPWPLGFKQGTSFKNSYAVDKSGDIETHVGCDEDNDYHGSVKAIMCTVSERQYTLTGCYKKCKRPEHHPGYKIDDDNKDEKLKWNENPEDGLWKCAAEFNFGKFDADDRLKADGTAKTKVGFKTCWADNGTTTSGTNTAFYGLKYCVPDAQEPEYLDPCYKKKENFDVTANGVKTAQHEFSVDYIDSCADECEKVDSSSDPKTFWRPGTWGVTGCRPKCSAPKTIPMGYLKTSPNPTCTNNGDDEFFISGWACDTNAGYSGTPKGKRGVKTYEPNEVDPLNQVFIFDGCFLDCLEPTNTSGYRLTTGGATHEDTSYANFRVEGKWECDTSIQGVTGEATTTTCDPTATTPGSSYKLSGCHHETCTTPNPVPIGYKRTTNPEFADGKDKWDDFSPKNNGWECATGYSKEANKDLAFTKCTGGSSDYTVAGCYADAKHPILPQGYKVADNNKDVKLAFKEFEIEDGYYACDTGYSAKEIKASYGPFYTLTGCVPDCIAPAEHPGYSKIKGLVTNNLSFNDFQVVGWECSNGYSSNSGFAGASVCAKPGQEYILSGCVLDCIPPEDTTGYVLNTPVEPAFYDFKVADETDDLKNSCTEDFNEDSSDGIQIKECDSPGGFYKLSGCDRKTCENPTEPTGYVRKADFNPTLTNDDDFAAKSHWKCAPGYSTDSDGVGVDKCTGKNKEYTLKNCVRDCAEPTDTTGYVKTHEYATKAKVKFNDFDVSQWECDTVGGFTGEFSATKCENPGEPYTLSGCQAPCTRPFEAINVAYRALTEASNTNFSCADEYFGTAGSQCTTGLSKKLTGCLPKCLEPLSTVGYAKPASGRLITEILHPHSFDVTGWTCAPGYSGTATVSACDENSSYYRLTGCFADCVEISATGYRLPSGGLQPNNLAYVGFSVGGWLCAAGYSGTPVAQRCHSGGSKYTLTGCVEDCEEPTSVTNYKKPAEGLSVENLGVFGFDVKGWECADGYSGKLEAKVCAVPGEEYTLSGCYRNCIEPFEYGYQKGASDKDVLNRPFFSVSGWTCSEGYSGEAKAEKCTEGGNPYFLKGCFKHCVAPTNTPGYVRGFNMVETLEHSNFFVSGWECAPGYSGYPEAVRCAGTHSDFRYLLSGCYQDCKNPLTQEGYLIDHNPTGDFTFTPSFSVTGVTCSDQTQGPAVVEVCNEKNGPYILKGCGVTAGGGPSTQSDNSSSDSDFEGGIWVLLGIFIAFMVVAVIGALLYKLNDAGIYEEQKRDGEKESFIKAQATLDETIGEKGFQETRDDTVAVKRELEETEQPRDETLAVKSEPQLDDLEEATGEGNETSNATLDVKSEQDIKTPEPRPPEGETQQ